MSYKLSFLLLTTIIISFAVNAQEDAKSVPDTSCVEQDIGDVIRAALRKHPKSNVEVGSILLVPIIGSNPATGFMYGIGGQYAFKLSGADTRYSLLSGSVQF